MTDEVFGEIHILHNLIIVYYKLAIDTILI